MVNAIEVNGKIIITILYVYYCEINADKTRFFGGHTTAAVETKKPKIDKLEFWEPNPEFNARRVVPTKISTTTAVKSNLRKDAEDTAKYTKGFHADIRHSAPKHILRYGHIERLPKNSDEDSDDTSDTDDSEDKNYNVKKNRNKNKDKKDYAEIPFPRNKHTFKNKKHNIDKHHKIDENHNMDEDHNVDKNHNINKNHNKNYMGTRHGKGNIHHMNKNLNKDESDEMDNNPSMNKFPHKEKKRTREKDQHIRIPKLQSEDVRGQIMESHWRLHEPSKLRVHKAHTTEDDNDGNIRSTRMTPMYLMQQPGEEDRPKSKGLPETAAAVALSPYALAQQIKDMLGEFTDANATFETIGRTVEYNDIVLVKITEKKTDDGKYFRAEESKYIDEVPEKKIIFIVHGLSVMGMSKLSSLNNASHMKILLSYYLKFLNKFDIYLIPMANPDGYSAAHTIALWNKNVSPQDACPGVALDRNFDVAWNVSRQMSSCSQLFPGTAPFSETETKAVREVFHYHGHKILAYIHVHAGTYSDSIFKGDAILYPRGFTESQSDDDKYIDLKGEIDEAMKNASFQVMSVTVDTLHNWYGKVSGSSVDYASTVYGIPYALEFVMQLYTDGGGGSHETYEYYALTEIWARLIETTFNNMWKSLHVTNEVKKK